MSEGEKKVVDGFIAFARMNANVQRRYFGKFVVSKRFYDLLKEQLIENSNNLGEDVLPPGTAIRVCGVQVDCEELLSFAELVTPEFVQRGSDGR